MLDSLDEVSFLAKAKSTYPIARATSDFDRPKFGRHISYQDMNGKGYNKNVSDK